MNTIQLCKPTPFEQMISKMANPWFALLYVTIVVLCILFIDQPVALYFQSLNLKVNAPWLRWVTNVGLGGLYIIPLFILAMLLRFVYHKPKWEMRAWFLWFCVTVPSVVCVILKSLLGRSRPTLLFSDGLYGFYGLKTSAAYWSFPSGHTTTIMGFAFGMGIVFPKYAYAFIFGALTIAVSRVLLTSHFVSDVLIASYLTFLEVIVIYYWAKRKDYLPDLPVCYNR